jgi:hypothetical protein
VAEYVKAPRAGFEAVIKSLLNSAPMPLTDMPRKRKQKKKVAKKR